MTHDEVHALFVYEPETGMLRRVGGRKDYPWRGIGKDRRYLAFTHRGTTIYLHHAVWLWHHGSIPPMLDHKDGDTRNCRIENLRLCTPAQNQYNSRRKSNNGSGFKGVVFKSGYRNPWHARIVVQGRQIVLGQFSTPEAAAAAYEAGAKRHAGAFANKG